MGNRLQERPKLLPYLMSCIYDGFERLRVEKCDFVPIDSTSFAHGEIAHLLCKEALSPERQVVGFARRRVGLAAELSLAGAVAASVQSGANSTVLQFAMGWLCPCITHTANCKVGGLN